MLKVEARRRSGTSSGKTVRSAAALILIALTALLFSAALAPPEPAAAAPQAPEHASYRAGLILVGFRPGVSASLRRLLQRRDGLAWMRALHARAGKAGPAKVEQRLGRAFIAGVRAGHEASTVGLLRRAHAVRYAEPDYVMHASGLRIPNDPSFGLQWGSFNLAQIVDGIRGVRGADDRAVAAWTVTTGSRSIVIAEVDTGVDYRHPDLAANIWTNPGGIGGCPAGSHGYNVIVGTCDPADDDTAYNGHGTHVAGIMGAIGNNRIGVAGTDWSTTILPVKWLDANASGDTDELINALDWLVKAKQVGVNIRVVNDSATFVGTPYSQALSDEIDLLGANNILFVTAAGNTAHDNDDPVFRRYPCGYDRPTELCVTATGQNDRLPAWANWGAHTVDLGAPGDNIYSTLRNGTYGDISGGSMAAAQVSGAAALILSRMRLSATGLRADMVRNVDRLPSLAGKVRTGGRLDVCRAISACAHGCKVPRLVGRALRQAASALRKTNCRLGRTRKIFSSRIKSGRVMSQSKRAGTSLPIGTTINLVVSKGAKKRP